MKKVLLILILSVLFAAAGFVWVRSHGKVVQADTSAPVAAVAVETTLPTPATFLHTVEVYGSLAPKSATEVRTEIAGRVVKVAVKEWDKVKPGDVLLELDPMDVKLAVNQNEAGVKMAKAQLLQAKVDLSRANRELERARKLKEGGLITGQELDERKTSLESAQAQVALGEAQIAQAEARLAEARHTQEKTTIRAPIEGTVSQRSVDIGDFPDKGGLLFTIVDNRILDFTANVSASDLSQVLEGQTLTFTVDGLPGRTFHGKVKRVNPLVRSTDRTGKILAEVENSDGSLKGGLYARGAVIVEEHRNATALPKAALMNWDLEKGSARLFVVDEAGVAHLRTILTGLTDENLVEIKSGLSGNEKIVVRGGFNLKEGDKVLETDGQAPDAAPAASRAQ